MTRIRQLRIPFAVATFCACLCNALALDIPYENKGADGDLIVNNNRVIDLSGATSKAWDAVPDVPGTGVYDSAKWAVVFKFKSVTIGSAATLSFANHGSRAPVVWLVDGDVTINGTLNLNGADGDANNGLSRLSEPGPGGFRGGDRASSQHGETGGFGPGGSFYQDDNGYFMQPSSALFGYRGRNEAPYAPTYGNSALLPLIGGSGGAGYRHGGGGQGAGAGGGAILIASKGRITINGNVLARGGSTGASLQGSGGAIRLVSEIIAGVGLLDVESSGGGHGRIRLEANDYQAKMDVRPTTQATSPDKPVRLWPQPNTPVARIVSVSGQSAPADPRSSLGPPEASPADVILQNGAGTGEIFIETDNLPATASVNLRISPRFGTPTEVPATYDGPTETAGRLRWKVQINLHPGFCAMQVRATAQ